jgi:hypothetical protein
MKQANNTNELQEFVENTLKQIKAGVGGEKVRGTISFEVAVTKSTDKGGKVGVSVLGLEGALKSENVSKIKFRVQTRGAIAPSEK